MQVAREKVAGGSAAGDRRGNSRWEINPSGGNIEEYESFFRAFFDKMLTNRGAFKIGGSLLFEFIPGSSMRGERLISPETSFFFHRMEEGFVYNADNDKRETKYKNSAIESYNYQKKVPPLEIETMEQFMPAI